MGVGNYKVIFCIMKLERFVHRKSQNSRENDLKLFCLMILDFIPMFCVMKAWCDIKHRKVSYNRWGPILYIRLPNTSHTVWLSPWRAYFLRSPCTDLWFALKHGFLYVLRTSLSTKNHGLFNEQKHLNTPLIINFLAI